MKTGSSRLSSGGALRFGRVDLLLVLVALMWGGNFSIIKVALADLPPLFFAGARFVVSVLVLVALAVLTGQPLRIERRHRWSIIGLGLLGTTLYQLVFILGIARTTADNAALILATVPAFVALLGSAFGLERVRPPGWLGVGLSLAGIYYIVTGSDRQATLEFGGATLAGDLLILLCMLVWAIYSLLMRPVVRHSPPVAVTVWATAVGTVPWLLIALPDVQALEFSQVPVRAWLAMGASAVVGISLPYVIWNYAIQQIGSARTSLYSYLVPPVALIVAWVWLGETLTAQQFLGGALALAGVMIARKFVNPVD